MCLFEEDGDTINKNVLFEGVLKMLKMEIMFESCKTFTCDANIQQGLCVKY